MDRQTFEMRKAEIAQPAPHPPAMIPLTDFVRAYPAAGQVQAILLLAEVLRDGLQQVAQAIAESKAAERGAS